MLQRLSKWHHSTEEQSILFSVRNRHVFMETYPTELSTFPYIYSQPAFHPNTVHALCLPFFIKTFWILVLRMDAGQKRLAPLVVCVPGDPKLNLELNPWTKPPTQTKSVQTTSGWCQGRPQCPSHYPEVMQAHQGCIYITSAWCEHGGGGWHPMPPGSGATARGRLYSWTDRNSDWLGKAQFMSLSLLTLNWAKSSPTFNLGLCPLLLNNLQIQNILA